MIRDRITAFLEKYETEIQESADELLDTPMPELTEELFGIFEKTGSRREYEQVYFTRRKLLAVFGMRALLDLEKEHSDAPGGTKERTAVTEAYLRRLIFVMEDICGEECWAVPAHVDRKANPDWRTTIDLFAAETAQTLGELTDRLDGQLPERIKKLVVENIERRVFQPYFTSAVGEWSWEHFPTNWCAVCAGSIGSACLHLMRGEPERLRDCLRRICEDALPYYIKGFAEDGACTEGVGYYFYGMTYFVNFAQELFDYAGGKADLFCGGWGDFPPMEEIRTGADGIMDRTLESGKDKRLLIAQFPAKCFFPDGKCVNFADCLSFEAFRMGVISTLALHYGKKQGVSQSGLFPRTDCAAGLHYDDGYRFARLKMDLLNTRRLLAVLDEEEETGDGAFYCLPSAQWCVMHSASGAGFACKGGHNAEAHNHNDVGHFIYEAGGNLYLTDLGPGEYTREYFQPGKRYQILCCSSFGHSVPVIDGKGEPAGPQYRSDFFEAKEDGSVSLELHAAYPEGTLDHFSRDFCFDRKTGRLQVKDVLVAGKEHAEPEVTERLITQIKPKVTGNQVLLAAESGSCLITVRQADAEIVIRESFHGIREGNKKVYAIQWRLPVRDGRAECEFEAEVCDGSGTVGREPCR